MGKILWVDLETTGTDVIRDCLIEIGAVVTDDSAKLVQIGDPFSVVIETHPEDWLDVVPVVVNMHTANGLMGESIVGPNTGLNDAIDEFEDWVDSFAWGGSLVYAIGGSGVAHFDREWLAHHTQLDMRYWSYDIGPVRRFARLAGIRNLSKWGYEPPASPKAHRALDDIQDHISEARALMAMMADR